MLTKRLIPAVFLAVAQAAAQPEEAKSGFDLRATFSADASHSTDNTANAGYRAVFYPTLKFNEHWTLTGVYQLNSAHPYPDASPPSPYRAKGYLVQGSLNYSAVGVNKSLIIRLGQLSTAFGSFLLRYDDAENPLINPPAQYGYYSAVSTLGLAGAEADATWGKWDARVQFTNSSPANPRGIFSRDQYGNWAGGAGFTIRQGFRIGISTYTGPYLDRQSPFYFPHESPPASLSARAWGVDAQWARGHWNLQSEWQHLVFPYHAIPTYRMQTGYFEAKRVLHPRWYAAARAGYISASAGGVTSTLEATAGYRPAASMLLKFSYQLEHQSESPAPWDNIVALQLVATLHPLSLAFH